MGFSLSPPSGVPLSLHNESFGRPLLHVQTPEHLAVPMFDMGAGAMLPVLREGESVAKNSILARTKNGAVWAVAPASGRLTQFDRMDIPGAGHVMCAFIKTSDSIPPLETVGHNPAQMSGRGIIQAARQACVIDEVDGMPLFYKLQRALREGVHLVIADCVDDTPYVTSALKTAADFGGQCADGAGFALKALEGGRIILAAYDPGNIDMGNISSKFGFIKTVRITGGYPAWNRFEAAYCDQPYVRIGAGALRALAMAVREGLPQTDAVLTVGGDCVPAPVNVIAPTGTLIRHLLGVVGIRREPKYIILGDTMRGLLTDRTDLPIFPGIRGVTAMSKLPGGKPAHCFSCGACVSACPRGLFPSEAHRLAAQGQTKEAAGFGSAECDGCGACSAVCPAGIELAELMQGL